MQDGLGTLANAKFLTARQVWLALDDEPYDSRRVPVENVLKSGWVSFRECELYHRQLFYWLLIRSGPCIFPIDSELAHGVPKQIIYHN